MRLKVDVLILIEHVVRELESAVLLKYYLGKKGYFTIIDTVSFNKEEVVLKYEADIVFVPWAYHKRDLDLYRNLLRRNKYVNIINFHHEQLTNPNSMGVILPDGDAKYIYHLSWGTSFSEALKSVGCPPKTIIQCGNIRLDFFKDRLRALSLKRYELSGKYKIPEDKKWILFIANSFHLWTQAKKNSLKKDGIDIEEQIECSTLNRNHFLQYVRQYLSENTDAVFIYRPHPSYAHEDEARWDIKEMVHEYPGRFFCISNNAIRDWILNVDLCISFHSTSVIECCVAGTPFFLFRTVPISKDMDYEFFGQFPYKIENYYDFETSVHGFKSYDYTDFKNKMKKYIDLDEQKYSVDQIVEKLPYIKKNTEETNRIHPSCMAWLKCFVRMVIKKMLFLLGKNKQIKSFFLSKKDPRFLHLLNLGADQLDEKQILFIEKKLDDILGE